MGLNSPVSPLSGIASGSDAISSECTSVVLRELYLCLPQRIFKNDVHIHGVKNKTDIGQYKDSLNLYKPK